MDKHVTLADIAADLDVSRATVSLVMRQSPLVADKTRVRVLESAERLGYVYNRAAASLRSNRSGTVGIIVTSVGNPFFAELTVGVESAVTGSGRAVILGQHSENIEIQNRLLNRMLEYRVDGIILTPAHGTTPRMLDRMTANGVSLVLCTRRVRGATVSYVGSDNVAGAKAATEHLLGHEPRALAFVGGRKGGSPRQERTRGLQAALRARGLSASSVVSIPTPATRDAGHAAATDLFRTTSLPIGILAYNDIVASGIAAAAREAGLTIGRDVALVGFDNAEPARYEQPPLTTVDLGATSIGVLAAETLSRAIDAGGAAVDVAMPNTLVVRESCGCPPLAAADSWSKRDAREEA